MRLLLLFFLCLFLVLPGRAQERVRHVQIYVVDSVQLEIHYDLINARPGDSVYFEVRSRLRGPLRILPEFVRGDIGTQITAGSDRRIIWDALANGYSLNEEVQAKVLVKTGIPLMASQPVATKPVTESASTTEPAESARRKKTTPTKPSVFALDEVPSAPATTTPATPVVVTPAPQPPASVAVSTPAPKQNPPQPATVTPTSESAPATMVPDSTRPPKTRYAGPAWALLSAVAPGIGNIFVQMPKPKVGLRPLLTIGCYGLIAYGLSERKKSQDEYAIYVDQKNMTAGEPYYQTANDHHHHYFMATRGAMVVAAADVILTFIKGLRNSQLQKASQHSQSVMLRPGIQAGQVTAVVRYSF
ncbi:hypothetical protein GO755_13815 [Spirosoma sp. HMF4905]|uniref:DUF5683 domain-containing protein n=1 Tax=Spirosoma arboris TaxID=2682092 RepID=A0A7K1SBB0_9BACT|nr:hypothetical protein [Spirosoma arboris]MVM31113.1 hypothetical protein [Spirosoma arboris]